MPPGDLVDQRVRAVRWPATVLHIHEVSRDQKAHRLDQALLHRDRVKLRNNLQRRRHKWIQVLPNPIH
jgi:hypothetical protein